MLAYVTEPHYMILTYAVMILTWLQILQKHSTNGNERRVIESA